MGYLTLRVHSPSLARDTDGFMKKVRAHMKKLQKLADRVKKYFNHPKIVYAA